MAKARKRRQRQRGGDSSFSCSSSSDEMSTEEAPPTGSSDIRAIIIAATKEIKQMLEEHKEELKDIKEQLKKLNEDNISLYTQLERLNCSSCDGSPPSRPEPNQMKPPRFRLKINSVVNETVETRKNVQTSAGNYIEVSLYDGGNPIAPNHPLASAEVMMVVLNGEFNKDNNQYNWSREDFEKSIVRPRRGNSATGDENHGIKSIVSNCTFYLTGGSHRHSNATIVNNSGNKNVRLGVMVLSPSEERVLEGLSNHFLVRDSSKKSNKQRKALGNGQEQNGPSSPTIRIQEAGNGIDIVPEQLPPTANMDNPLGEDPQHLVEPTDDQRWRLDYEENYQWTEGFSFPDTTQMFPVQLLWDRPFVEPTKHWNLLDQLMPLYSSQTKIHGGDFPAIRLTPQHYDSLTTYSEGLYQRLCFNEQASLLTNLMRDLEITTTTKHVMQTHQNRGVLIQPVEPDDPDDETPLRRKLNKKYHLQFVNKMCKDYYTWEQIKADDGNLVDIALYDESNTKITSGPLSSASVEVVVLYSDFNAAGQDYWDSEEFSSCIVCAQSENAMPVLGGHLVLVLVNGEASLSNAFFQQTSRDTRTGKFKMGVMLASTRVERVQEGISDPFSVWDHRERGNDLGIIAPQATPGQVATVIPHSLTRRNKRECEQAELLPHLQDPEVMQHQNAPGSVDKLSDTFEDALDDTFEDALDDAFLFIGSITRHLDVRNIRFPSSFGVGSRRKR